MVDSISVCMDVSLGRCHAFAKTDSETGSAVCIYDGLRDTWILVWNALRSGACGFVWVKPKGHDCMDCGGPAF